MKRATLERNIAAALFVLVMIVFSFAQRDCKKITPPAAASAPSINPDPLQQTAAEWAAQPRFFEPATRR